MSSNVSDVIEYFAGLAPDSPLAQLRAQPETKGALLIAVSGYGREADLRSSRRAGFDHHLIKPVNVEELLKLLAMPAGMEVDVPDL